MKKDGNAKTAVFSVFSLIWIIPVVIALLNSFKSNDAISRSIFSLPGADSFVLFDNYRTALTFGNYPFLRSFGYSVLISSVSTALIIVCCSMAAWYIVRVASVFSKIYYYLCLFSLAVPFQMLMFTLSSTAYRLGLDKPWTIPAVYLGYGAGMAVFMFTGFVRGLPYDIEEAAIIDGCGPVRTFFSVVFPMMSPIAISVGILQLMWIWNDYLLPYLVLDITEYRTIPIHIQYLKGSYGSVDLGASLAVIVMSLIPIMVIYILCQKYIVKGIAAGAVKG
ncbi:MAG: carbohydrate ABC transporter permease [Oscillospiraceae bacterium]|nr:carbohydrate ABC transporter permease [Oscillospiraceae bacterium]MCR5168717.1 carbohydrate ABC transporter permease [Oscillospiraceae bacterium]